MTPSWFDPIVKKRAQFLHPGIPDEPPSTPPASSTAPRGYSQPAPVGRTPRVVSEPEPTPFAKQEFKKTAAQIIVERMRERVELARRYKQKQVVGLTQQQYFQKTYEAKKDIGRQKSEYYTLQESIDPTRQYEYEGRIVSGAELKSELESGYLPQLEQAEQESQLVWSQARDLPKDTKVTKTDEGYEFKFRDTRQEAIRRRMTGTPAERITEFGRFWATSVIMAPSFYPGMAGAIVGGKKEDVLNVYSQSMQPLEQARKTRSLLDIPVVAAASYTEPGGLGRFSLEVAATSYLMGAGVGALKKTVWGAKPLLQSRGVWSAAKHGKIFTKSFKPSVGKPIWEITRSRAVEFAVAGYYGKDIPGSVKDKPWETLASLAITLPFVGAAYKAGHRYGGGLVDRMHSMSKVKGLNRIRQQGLYETFDVLDSGQVKSPKYKVKPYDLTNVERIGRADALKTTEFIKSEYGKRSRPSFGGSLSLDIMGIPRRKMPSVLGEWALKQVKKSKTFVGERKLRHYKSKPKDSDLMLRDILNIGRDELGYMGIQSSLERAELIKKPHVIDIWRGGYKPGSELGFGLREMKRVKGQIYDPWLSKVKITPEVMEGYSGYTYSIHSGSRGMKLSPAEMKIGGRRFDMPDIRISTTYLQKYPSYVKGKGTYWAQTPVRGTSYGIPGEVSAKKIILHEIGHHEFPLTSAGRGRISTGIVERVNVLLERKVFRDPKMMSAVDVFIETGKWTYPGKKMNVHVLDPLEQFGRTGEAILPSNVALKGYRVPKDVQRWWNVGKAIIDKNKHIAKKLTNSMDKVVHPELYKSEMPPVSFGERFIKRIGGGVEQKPVWKISVDSKGKSRIRMDFEYPKSTYPTRILKPVIGFKYPAAPSPKKYPSAKLPFYKTPIYPPYKPSVVPPYKTSAKPPSIPPSKITPPIFHPTPSKPPTYPPSKPPQVPPPITIYGKEIMLPKVPTYKEEPTKRTKKKRKSDEVFARRKKPLVGLPKVDVPRFKFRKFDIGNLLTGVKT